MTEARRYHDLDLIRSAAMLLGVIIHVNIFFLPPHELFWGTGEYQGDEVNLQLPSFIHLFRMQLFFLLAGFFAELVADRKGFGHLVRDRVKRILLPFLVGVFVLLPIHGLLMNGNGSYYDNQLVGLDLPEQLGVVSLFGLIDGKPGMDDWIIHFWFIFYLLVFYLLHFLFRPVLPGLRLSRAARVDRLVEVGLRSRWGFLALALLTLPFQYFIVDVSLPPSGFNVPLLDLALYFVFYLFGAALYHQRALLADMTRNAWFLLVLATPFFLFVNGATTRIDFSAPVIKDITTWKALDLEAQAFAAPTLYWDGLVHNGWDKVLVAFIRSTLCWMMCLGFIGLAHRYLTRPKRIIRYLADSAYWVYWIHLTITFKLSCMAQQLEWGSSLFRSYLVFVLSTLLIYWTYNSFVRYSWLGDFFMGKRKSRSDPGEEEFRLSALVKRLAPGTALVGVVAFLLGEMLRYDESYRGAPALVEAYVARDEETLRRYDSFDEHLDILGNTPLHHAARRSEGLRLYDPMPILIERTGDLNTRNDFGRTALFVATRTGNRNDIKQLLDAGADPNIPDIHGHTPAHVAAIKTGVRGQSASAAYSEILELLSSRGADLSQRDAYGRTVADCLTHFGPDVP